MLFYQYFLFLVNLLLDYLAPIDELELINVNLAPLKTRIVRFLHGFLYFGSYLFSLLYSCRFSFCNFLINRFISTNEHRQMN